METRTSPEMAETELDEIRKRHEEIARSDDVWRIGPDAQWNDIEYLLAQLDAPAVEELAREAAQRLGCYLIDARPVALIHIANVIAAVFVGQAVEAAEWQPIETAPKDGREVLLMVERRAGIKHGMLVGHYMPGGHCIEDHPAIDEGWYFWSGSMFDKASKPIRWMPLSAPPSVPAGTSPITSEVKM